MDRSRKFSLLTAALALAMAGLFTVACDSGTQEPAAPDSAMPLPSGDVTDSQSDSALPTDMPEVAAVPIPEAFPDEVPIYPGAVAALASREASTGVPRAAVRLQTVDSPESVYDFYVDKFSSEGWTIEEREDLKRKNAVSATNGKCKVMMLAAPDKNGDTNIILVTEC